MEHSSLEAIRTAARVLASTAEMHNPDPGDIVALRRFAPHLSHCHTDELVREVIILAVNRMASGARGEE
jgi:hypothetical protein